MWWLLDTTETAYSRSNTNANKFNFKDSSLTPRDEGSKSYIPKPAANPPLPRPRSFLWGRDWGRSRRRCGERDAEARSPLSGSPLGKLLIWAWIVKDTDSAEKRRTVGAHVAGVIFAGEERRDFII